MILTLYIIKCAQHLVWVRTNGVTSLYILAEEVHKVVVQSNKLLKTKVPPLCSSLALYLANEETEHILFRPIRVGQSVCASLHSHLYYSLLHMYMHTIFCGVSTGVSWTWNTRWRRQYCPPWWFWENMKFRGLLWVSILCVLITVVHVFVFQCRPMCCRCMRHWRR